MGGGEGIVKRRGMRKGEELGREETEGKKKKERRRIWKVKERESKVVKKEEGNMSGR